MGVDGDPGRRRPTSWWSTTPADLVPEAPYELVEKMRASVVVLGPLLARCGWARVSHARGRRLRPPAHRHAPARPSSRWAPSSPRPTATSRAGSTSTVAGSPRLVGQPGGARVPEPHRHRQRADGRGAGQGDHRHRERRPRARGLATWPTSSTPWGRGSPGRARRASRSRASTALEPATHAVIPDRLVVATFLVAAGLAGGEVVVEDGRPEHMDMLLRKLTATGMEIT